MNKDLNVKTKSYGQIIKDNIFSFFNLINTILLVCIIIAGSIKNALFFVVVIWNFALGVIQEIRAKRTIDKLSLLTAPHANVLRDGVIINIAAKDILLGDVMQLKNGNQICADCVILTGECQVNESLITGESDPIFKKAGDHMLSGSYLISGSVKAEVEHVSEDNYVSKITLGAKRVKKNNSIIMTSVKKVVKIVAIALIPLAGLMVWKNFFMIDQGFSEAMVATVAAVSAMIPGGLILLVSMVMAVSVVRLSMHDTLAQDLYCVENLARVDVLCLDKTGTITEGKLAIEQIVGVTDGKLQALEISGSANDEAGVNAQAGLENPGILKKIKLFADAMEDENPTIEAIRDYVGRENQGRVPEGSRQIGFSSETKRSVLELANGQGSLILGAPEIICPDMPEHIKEQVKAWAEDSKRVLAFGVSEKLTESDNAAKVNDVGGNLKNPGSVRLLAFIVIGDKVRENAKDTLEFFKRQGVMLKVISGDNPVTVSKIAAEAGFEGSEKYIDARILDTYEKILAAVDEYTIFGRVTPYQKLDLIRALKERGHVVSMIGDGANDVLALKESDCSIAMQSGSDAARSVASMVLLKSDFASLPVIVAEGRKSINNLQRSASLYLTKTTYAFILTIAFLFLPFTYPFQNIQVTLVGVVTIGMPSFFLALEPNNNRIKEHFLRNVFRVALPSGVLSVIAILCSSIISQTLLGATTAQIQTVATFTTILVGYIMIFDIAGKMTKWKWVMMGWIVFVAVGCVVLFPALFDIAILSWQMWLLIAICAVGFALIHVFIFRYYLPSKEKQM